MKKGSIFILICLLIMAFSLSASADNDLDARLVTSYSFNGDNIVINAHFNDIKVKDGIISLEYDIEYDHTSLELVGIEHIIPEEWNALIAEENVENFSFQSEGGVYRWGYAVISLGKGAKVDKSLGIKLEFKPIKDEISDIELNYRDIRGEIIEGGKTTEFVHMSSNSAKITFNPINVSETVMSHIDVDPSNPRQNNKYYPVDNLIEVVEQQSEASDIGLILVFIFIVVFELVILIYFIVRSIRG